MPVTIGADACLYNLPSTEVLFYVGMTIGISNVISIVMDAINLTLIGNALN